jgi:NADPH:quinone reductase-like Zn-dependent oxidoreductase
MVAQTQTPDKGFDVIFNSSGGASIKQSYSLLGPLGRLCIFGASSFISSANSKRNLPKALLNLFKFPVFFPLEMMNSSRSVCGFGVLRIPASNQKLQAALREVSQLWADGKVLPTIDRTFALEQVGEAQTYLEDRKNFGKVVLII